MEVHQVRISRVLQLLIERLKVLAEDVARLEDKNTWRSGRCDFCELTFEVHVDDDDYDDRDRMGRCPKCACFCKVF